MRGRIYGRLAAMGIKNSREIYAPYILSGIVMAAGFYILLFLSDSTAVASLKGGDAVVTLLSYSVRLYAVFSLPFLIYTDMAVLKRCRRELGLYSVLGMDRDNLLRVLVWESLITYALAVGIGYFSGIILSKLAEIAIAAIMGQTAGYGFSVDILSLLATLLVYFAIYAVILLISAVRVGGSDPVSLLRSENEGEREPSAKLFFAVTGVVLIIAAYILSAGTRAEVVGSESILSGLTSGAEGGRSAINDIITICIERIFAYFALIASGTVLLFVSGSVYLCRRLKSNKAYYYHTEHFVSVSQLLYRMKRNGFSLAAICVLSTLVLVSLTGAIGFFSGIYRTVDVKYPYDLGLYAEAPEEAAIGSNEFADAMRRGAEERLSEADIAEWSGSGLYFAGQFVGYTDGVLDLATDFASGQDAARGENSIVDEVDGIVCVRTISIDDYNRLTGEAVTLSKNEVLIAEPVGMTALSAVSDMSGGIYTIKTVKRGLPMLAPFEIEGETPETGGFLTVLLAVPDLYTFFYGFDRTAWDKGSVRYMWEYDITVADGSAEALDAAYAGLSELTEGYAAETGDAGAYLRTERFGAAIGLAGGLMFLAIIVTALLIFVSVLIMYYKQTSEGYEDRKRFVIMKKLGMTDAEVRGSIGSQMRTVFFFPLIMAGLHLIFAVPPVSMMLMFTVRPRTSVIIATAAVSFVAFAAAYVLVYRRTIRAYYRIIGFDYSF